jgi:hypothetical protein
VFMASGGMGAAAIIMAFTWWMDCIRKMLCSLLSGSLFGRIRIVTLTDLAGCVCKKPLSSV